MERLTVPGFKFDSSYVASNLQSYQIAEALNRLQQYEDIGLSPEEVATLVQAKKENPTADAVFVVRCRECKYRDPYAGESGQCLHIYGLNACDGNDYCSYGERKEENNGTEK